MGESLHRVAVMGAALGLLPQLAEMFPEPQRPSEPTQAERLRMAAAERKRARRRQRMIALQQPKAPTGQDPEWAAYDAEERRREAAVMREVRRLVHRGVYKDIQSFIYEDGSFVSGFAIVNAPGGHEQEEDGYAFKRIFIDQYCNGGYSGDDFAGRIWIPLNAGKWLQYHYSC